MSNNQMLPIRLSMADLKQVIVGGWRLFRATPGPSITYALVAVCIGFALLMAVSDLGFTPMSLPLAGGFMLTAPAMLGGFFQIAKINQAGGKVKLATPFVGFIHAPLTLWIIALFCSFVFLIWLTDAGVLYSFMLGGAEREAVWLWFVAADRSVVGFWFWGSLMGGFLASVIFCVAAFSVPLLFERRATLIQAVHASVRAVFSNLIPCTLWALMLTLLTVTSVFLLPLLLILLPVLAFASYLLYQRVFPASD